MNSLLLFLGYVVLSFLFGYFSRTISREGVVENSLYDEIGFLLIVLAVKLAYCGIMASVFIQDYTSLTKKIGSPILQSVIIFLAVLYLAICLELITVKAGANLRKKRLSKVIKKRYLRIYDGTLLKRSDVFIRKDELGGIMYSFDGDLFYFAYDEHGKFLVERR